MQIADGADQIALLHLWSSSSCWRAIGACLLTLAIAGSAWPAGRGRAPAPVSAAAEAIYREGLLPDGSALRGERSGGELLQGRMAACLNCHRRSGLGMIEGDTIIPPITGESLFQAVTGPVTPMPRHAEITPAARGAYNDKTLARALREGINADGHSMSYLMPRFALDDATMAMLILYLKQLSRGPAPGVGEDSLQFATIVTSDADPAGSQAMLAVLEQYFGPANTFYHGESPPAQYSSGAEAPIAHRRQLHVWTLTGPAETWETQLHERLRREPVFAVISGIGGRTWAPVHRFCESESIPCLLPNVDLPVVAEQDFYPMYFSRGVLLEAAVLARTLRELPAQRRPRQVIQLYRQGDIGAEAAASLQALATDAGLQTVNRPLPADGSAGAVATALESLDARDAVVLWLRPPDLAALRSAPRDGTPVFLSGIMGGLEHAPLPTAWRQIARMTYPYELPELRAGILDFPFGWFRFHKIPITNEPVQVNTYVACGLLESAIKAMHHYLVRDYLVERFEATLETTMIAGYYPHLSLAPGQRFASKGGYLVRFTESTGTKIAPTSDWVIP